MFTPSILTMPLSGFAKVPRISKVVLPEPLLPSTAKPSFDDFEGNTGENFDCSIRLINLVSFDHLKLPQILLDWSSHGQSYDDKDGHSAYRDG